MTENVNGGLSARGNTLSQRAAVHGFRISLGAGLARRGSRSLPQIVVVNSCSCFEVEPVQWPFLLLQRLVGAEQTCQA